MFKNLSNEVWKDIEGYEGLYQVSNLGRVRSLGHDKYHPGRMLKPGKDRNGYLFVNLYKNGEPKHCSIHRLVAIAFIPNPDNLPEVNHINEKKQDCRVENLSWVSRIQNCCHGSRTQRSAEKHSKRVAQYTLDGTLVAVYPSTHEAARQTDFKQSSISACCCEKLKTYKGYIWKYID